MESIAPIAAWLAQTSLNHALSSIGWAVPLLQSVHIIAVAILFWSVAMLDLRLAGAIGRREPLRSNSLRFYPWIWCALLVLITTGGIQIVAEPVRELENTLFWSKMGLILAASLSTTAARPCLAELPLADHPAAFRTRIRGCGAASLVLWVGVITCGRWIAYAGGAAS